MNQQQFQQAGGAATLPPGYSNQQQQQYNASSNLPPGYDNSQNIGSPQQGGDSKKGIGTAIALGVAGVAAAGIAGYAIHSHNQSQQQQQQAMANTQAIPPFQGAGASNYAPVMANPSSSYPQSAYPASMQGSYPQSGGAYPQSGAYPPPPMQGGFPGAALAGGALAGGALAGGALAGAAYAGSGYGGPASYPPPPAGYAYSGMPAPYMPRQYSYAAAYSPQVPFAIPMGLPPHLANKMMQASAAFRSFDTNCSGSLSKKEFKRALRYLGFYMHPGQAKQLFYMVDTNMSGHISEREFCEWWMHAFPY